MRQQEWLRKVHGDVETTAEVLKVEVGVARRRSPLWFHPFLPRRLLEGLRAPESEGNVVTVEEVVVWVEKGVLARRPHP